MVERLVPQPGVEVIVDERRYQIMQVLDLERVLIRDVATGEAKPVGLTELRPAPPLSATPANAAVDHDTQQIDERHWQLA